MENEELKKVLNRLHIPGPSDEAKERAVQSAMHEFRLAAEKNKNRVKGFAWLNRLISKKPKGGFFMNRTIAASTAGLAISVITFAIVFSPLITSQIRRGSAPTPKEAEQVKKETYSQNPPESITLSKTEEDTARPSLDEKGKINANSAPPDVPAPQTTPFIATLHDDGGSGNVAGSVKIGMADKLRSEPLSGASEIARSSDKTDPGTTEGKKEFTMEEITDSAQRRETTPQKIFSSDEEMEARKRVAYEAGTAAKPKSLSNAFATITGTSSDGIADLNQSAPANGFTLEEIAVRNVKGLDSSMIPSEYVGRDKFEDIKTNTVKLVSEEPVSTFSIDVDTSSYAFVRRALNNGYLPQADSVRIEELINYFDYDYPLPKDKLEPFRPTVAVFQTPWNADTKLLHIGIKGYDIVQEKKPGANLTFLIDVSGSMESEDKLPLLKNSLRMLVETLSPDDTVAIAVYAGAAGTVLERTKASEKQKILAAIDRLQAGGSTAGGEGIQLAYSLAESGMDPKAVNRIILATDGDFNVGITDTDVLQDFIERKRKSGIYLSVLGFGQGNYNDELMQRLAQNGNGNAAYIDNLNEARKVLVDEAKGTLFTIAKDVKIQVEFNPDMVREYRLIGYETRQLNREDFKNDNVDAGDIGSGHSVTAIYEIAPKGSEAQMIDDLRYGSKNNSEGEKKSGNASEYAFLKIRYKLPDEDTSREISTPIDKGTEYKKISDAPADSRFASAVAAFGQLLRGDAYINRFTYDDVISLARGAKKDDPFGYRTEFINLVRLAKTASTMGNR